MLAGAGVGRGQVIGSSDRQGGHVHSRPVSPKDILRTVYHLMGVDAERSIPDRQSLSDSVGRAAAKWFPEILQ